MLWNNKKAWKVCESLANIRTLCWQYFSEHFVSHVEYLRIPDKVSIFDFGRPQKWIQHRKCSPTASTWECLRVFDFLKFEILGRGVCVCVCGGGGLLTAMSAILMFHSLWGAKSQDSVCAHTTLNCWRERRAGERESNQPNALPNRLWPPQPGCRVG